jgi:hypothetical protein
MDKFVKRGPAMKAVNRTTLAMVMAVLGFVATVAWAQEAPRDIRVAESVICACVGNGNVG